MSCLKQLWWIAKYAVHAWLEWQDAKSWAKAIRPGWLQFAIKSNNTEVRKMYKRKILMAYRGEEDE